MYYVPNALGGDIIKFILSTPIYLQVINNIKASIATSEKKAGDKLPSSRDLAVIYSINPNTASRVYKEMEQQKLCYTKRGLGTFVTEDKDIIANIRHEMSQEYVNQYVSSMKSLSYTKDDMVEKIKNKEVN